jgi:hypothetical protein
MIIQLMPVPSIFNMMYAFEPYSVGHCRDFNHNKSLAENEILQPLKDGSGVWNISLGCGILSGPMA